MKSLNSGPQRMCKVGPEGSCPPPLPEVLGSLRKQNLRRQKGPKSSHQTLELLQVYHNTLYLSKEVL